jgi:hypothetical protein
MYSDSHTDTCREMERHDERKRCFLQLGERLKMGTSCVSDPGICNVNPGKLHIIVGALLQAKYVNIYMVKTFQNKIQNLWASLLWIQTFLKWVLESA